MKIDNARRRRAISPVLATVILIAITLIAAIAIAGFVFGLFGTFTSSANLQLSVVSCTHGIAGNVAGSGYCELAVTNTGGSSGSITGCSIYGNSGVSGAYVGNPPVTAATETVKAGTTSAAPVNVECTGTAVGAIISAGAAVSGQLIVASGAPLAFSAVAS